VLISLHKIIGTEVDVMATLPQNIMFSLMITFLITCLHEAYFFFMQWKTWQNRSEKLHEENIRSQYETLKSQVNPHFLFNNLNTLANLIEENPKAAVDYVNRTADYYRKILNLRDQEVIQLTEEIELVNDYVFLQKKRFENNLVVNIDLPKTIMQTYVAPLCLQMLVENALKHNIISKEKPLTIDLYCTDLEFVTVRNSLQKRETETASSKMGLKNIQQRYEYLTSKKVIIDTEENQFSVSVPLLNL
jgi:LytS/YehU family sensor histidine kinase